MSTIEALQVAGSGTSLVPGFCKLSLPAEQLFLPYSGIRR